MDRTRHLIRIFLSSAMLTALAFVVMSCAWVAEDSPGVATVDSEEADDSFQIRFQIQTRNIETSRADDSDEIKEECGSVAENFINLKDIHYYLFKGTDRKFLADITPDIDTEKTTAINSEYSIYEVVAKIDHNKTDYFRNNRNGTIDFFILAFANYSTDSGYGNVTLPDFKADNTLQQIFESPFSPVINQFPDTEKLMRAADKAQGAARACFPMAGLQRFTLSGTWFETMSGAGAVDLTAITGKSLNMLRAVAKLEVIDRINMKTNALFDNAKDAAGVRISGVAIEGVMKNARVLPSANNWEDHNLVFETQQVGVASLPEPVSYETASLQFVYDEAATLNRQDRCPVFSCYIWEYRKPEETPDDKLPHLSVTVKNPSEVGSGDHESATYSMLITDDMSPSAKDPKPQESFLRNHIYRYEISGASDNLSIKWSVCPMDKASADITFN